MSVINEQAEILLQSTANCSLEWISNSYPEWSMTISGPTAQRDFQNDNVTLA